MKHYQWLRIFFGDQEIKVWSTNADMLNWIEGQVREAAPKYKKAKGESFLPSGERYYVSFDNLQGKGYDIGLWIVKQLGEQGWKPECLKLDSITPLRVGVSCFDLLREVDEQPLA